MDVSERFDAILQEGWRLPLPRVVSRDARLFGFPGKSDAIVGMRRVGKTSLVLQHLSARVEAGFPRKSMVYVNFEDDRIAGVAMGDLHHLDEAALRLGDDAPERWFYLDEVQNVAGWERFVRRLTETPGYRVIFTGSSSKLLSAEIATSMRGRSLTTELLPFSFREALRYQSLEVPDRFPLGFGDQAALDRAFDAYMRTGGFPEVFSTPEGGRDSLLRGYVDIVLLRDVVERHKIGNVPALRALTRRLLAHPGQAFTANKTASDLKSQGFVVSREMVGELVQHLEDAYLLCFVPFATDSEGKRAMNPRKVYPMDPSLSASLVRGRDEKLGWKLENFVYLELRRRGYEIAWARTKSGYEVDFVARHYEREPLLVQVSWDISDATTRARELRALEEAADEHDIRRALLITRFARETLRAGTCEVEVLPASRWLASPL